MQIDQTCQNGGVFGAKHTTNSHYIIDFYDIFGTVKAVFVDLNR